MELLLEDGLENRRERASLHVRGKELLQKTRHRRRDKVEIVISDLENTNLGDCLESFAIVCH